VRTINGLCVYVLIKFHVREGRAPASTTIDDIWRAKRQYSSAFHPDTGELMFLPGRMSFQVPGNMVITGLMMTFYRLVVYAYYNEPCSV